MRKTSRIRLWAVVLWLCVWQLGSMVLNSDILLVSPLQVMRHLGTLTITALFWRSIGFSLLRIVGGFLTALCCGCVLAALAARFRWVQDLLAPLMLTIKSVPVASFIILALIWFSSRNLAALIAFLMVLPVIYSNVLGGIRGVDWQLLEMAQVFSISIWRRLRYLYAPQLLPHLRTACAVALGLCWKAGVAAEVIGMPRGSIGERLQQAKVYLNTPELFAWTLVIVLLSLVFERLFLWTLEQLGKALERM